MTVRLLPVGQHTEEQSALAPPPADFGLRCPVCEYNLTGVAEHRCPECGNVFDPDALRAILARAPAPIAIWDDADRSILIRFVFMCLITWFMPWRMAELVPPRCRRRSIRTFQWMTMAAAVCPVSVIILVNISPIPKSALFDIVEFLSISVGCWVGFILFEVMLGRIMVTTLTPKDAGLTHYDIHADYGLVGVVGFFRSFAIVGVALACYVYLFRPSLSFSEPGRLLVAVFWIAVWWWAALSAPILRQSASLLERIGCILSIPFIAAFAGFLGLTATTLLMLPLTLFCVR